MSPSPTWTSTFPAAAEPRTGSPTGSTPTRHHLDPHFPGGCKPQPQPDLSTDPQLDSPHRRDPHAPILTFPVPASPRPARPAAAAMSVRTLRSGRTPVPRHFSSEGAEGERHRRSVPPPSPCSPSRSPWPSRSVSRPCPCRGRGAMALPRWSGPGRRR